MNKRNNSFSKKSLPIGVLFPLRSGRNNDSKTALFLTGIRYIQKLSAFLPRSLWQKR